MNTRMLRWVTLLAALAITIQLTAQDNLKRKHQQYKLYDVGTFGGPGSDVFTAPAFFENTYINNRGTIVGTAMTAAADPFYPHCFYNCYVSHALTFRDGQLTDLGNLPGDGNSSVAMGIAANGLIAGVSETGALDPLTGYPAYHAVFWKGGNMIDLGTFGGALSQAWAVNSKGQVAGAASNTIPDQYAVGLGPCVVLICSSGVWPVATQQRAFVWQDGVMRDLGTLGGNDAAAWLINESGQVAGVSYTNTTPNPTTGLPTQDPFLWDHGKMIDMGSLGGTFGALSALNTRGQAVGWSYLPGDQLQHGIVWQKGVLTDLGTFGGSQSNAVWINNAGDIAGIAGEPGDGVYPAALWSHGQMLNLGTLPGDDTAFGNVVNSARQVVGTSCMFASCSPRGFLWENGGPMVDLTALVEPPFDGVVYNPFGLNERGEIVAIITLPTLPGNFHLALLVPDGDCDDDCEQRIAASQKAAVLRPATTGAAVPASGRPPDWLRNRLGRRVPTAGRPVAPFN